MLRATEESPAADGGVLIIDESDHLFIDLPSLLLSSPPSENGGQSGNKRERRGQRQLPPPPSRTVGGGNPNGAEELWQQSSVESMAPSIIPD